MGDPKQEISRGQQPDDTREPRLLIQQGAATIGQPARPSKWTRGVELGALIAACLLLLWLNRGDRGPEPLPGAFLGPAWSFAATFAAVWLAPGYVLCRLARAPWSGGWLQLLALSFGLGLAWLSVPATVVLLVGTRMDVLAGLVTSLNCALVLSYGVTRWKGGRARAVADEGSVAGAGLWLPVAAAAALAHLLAVSARRPRFSFGSDEWILMRVIRYFLEAKPIADTFDFDVWDLVVALVIRLARVDLIEAYRMFLPPLLIVAASLAFLALAEALFRDRAIACFSYLVLALYAVSDMHTRGEGVGMGLLVRVMEDKYVACFVMVPLAQGAFVSFLRQGHTALLAVAAALSLAAILVFPLSLVWLGLTAGATCLAALVTGRLRARPRVLVWLALTLAAGSGLAWWLRSWRAAAYFRLFDPSWPFNAVLRGLSRKQLLILSPEDGWFMAHPALLSHPLMIAAVASVVCLIPRFGRCLRVQFLVCSTLVPLLVVYNPLTARLLGGWITPWMIHRVVWVVPVALTLGYALHGVLGRVQRRLGAAAARTRAAHGWHAMLWLAMIGVMSVLLSPRIGESWRALKARNRVGVTEGERELMQAIARDRQVGGHVLAPRGIGIRLPAWTSRLEPYPGLDVMRWGDPERLREWTAFYEASSVGEAEVALLRKRNIDFVITRTGSHRPGDPRAAGAVQDRVHGQGLLAVRMEAGTVDPGRDPVTSFDTRCGNLRGYSP